MDFMKFSEGLDKIGTGPSERETRLLDIFYELLGPWSDPLDHDAGISMNELWDLAENFSAVALKYEENMGFQNKIHEILKQAKPVQKKRLL